MESARPAADVKAGKPADKATHGKHPKLSDECSTVPERVVSVAAERIGT